MIPTSLCEFLFFVCDVPSPAYERENETAEYGVHSADFAEFWCTNEDKVMEDMNKWWEEQTLDKRRSVLQAYREHLEKLYASSL